MQETAKLVLKVESGQVTLSRKELDLLGRSAGTTEKATGKMALAFTRFIGPVALAAAALSSLKKIISVSREFDILNAQLITATGSTENAAIAFEAISEFAAKTPFDLGQVTEAFVLLVNRGLDPSEKALTAWGDFASAMGRQISEVVTAVGQASVGEFESLKTLGVVARTEGDNIRFTFRGMSEVVKKSSSEIEGYLQRLAENNFAGAMGERSKTLDGAISNLADSWNLLWLAISQESPIGDAIQKAVRLGITGIENLNKLIKGETLDSIGVLVMKLDTLTMTAGKLGDARYGRSKKAIAELTEELTKFSDLEIERARNVNIWNAGLAAQEKIGAALVRVRRDSTESFETRQEEQSIAVAASQAELDAIQATIAALDKEIAKEKELSGAKADRLARFIQSGDTGGPTEAAKKQFEILRVSLLSEEDALADSYKKRSETASNIFKDSVAEIKAIEKLRGEILAQEQTEQTKAYLETLTASEVAANNIKRESLITRLKLDKEFAEDKGKLGVDTRAQDAIERLRQDMRTEEEIIQQSFKARKDIVEKSSEDTGDLLARIEEKKNKDLRKLQQSQWDKATSAFGDLQNNLLILARTGNSKIGKVYKAAAIAQAIIATIKSVQNALADVPWPFNYAAAAVAVAAGAANVQAIRNQPIGQYADGGILGGNSPSGDRLTFKGNSGEMILNFAQQKELLSMANGKKQSGGGGGVNVNVYTLPGETAEVKQDGAGNIEIMMRRVVSTVSKQLFEGHGQIDQGLGVALRRRGLASA